jgi:ATP-dependent DNA ligase
MAGWQITVIAAGAALIAAIAGAGPGAGRPQGGPGHRRAHPSGLAVSTAAAPGSGQAQAKRAAATGTTTANVFDLLYRGGDWLLGLPYTERRERLDDLGLDADPVRTPPWYPGDAQAVQAVSLQHGLEGVVGKPLATRYQPGGGRDWIKLKNVRHQELLICGWMPGTGRRAPMIGSLVLGG